MNGTFKFVLQQFDGVNVVNQKKLTIDPEGWSELGRSYSRKREFFGVLRQYVIELGFNVDPTDDLKSGKEQTDGGGKLWIDSLVASGGPDVEAFIGVYEEDQPTDKYLLADVGKFDFSTWSSNEFQTSVNIVDTSFADKVIKRKKVKVNVLSEESIGGVALTPPEPQEINLHQREILEIADLVLDEVNAIRDTNLGANDFRGHAIPVEIVNTSDIQDIQRPIDYNIHNLASLFHGPSTSDKLLQLTISFKGTYVRGTTGGDAEFVIRKFTDANGDLSDSGNFEDTIIHTIPALSASGSFDIVDFTTSVDLVEDNGVSFILTSGLSIFETFTYTYESASMAISSVDFFGSTKSPSFFKFDVGKQVIENITDTKDSFVSSLYGGIKDGYAEDGAKTNRVLLSGNMIRNIPDSSVTISLVDLFEAFRAMDNIGLGIERRNGKSVVVVEELPYFFTGTVIEGMYSVAKLKVNLDNEYFHNSIEIGYAKSEVEEVNGLNEFNNQSEYVNRLESFEGDLELISKIRADGSGLEKLRRLQYNENPTEDAREDEDNWVVDGRFNGATFQAKKDEGYDFVENIFSPETAYNLDLSPRDLMNVHGSTIRASLQGMNYFYDEGIKFQFAKNNSDIRKQKTGEAVTVGDEDIAPSTLRQPLWTGRVFEFESPLTTGLIRKIELNPYGLIKFSTATRENTTWHYYGWILEANAANENNEMTWKILEANVRSPEVTLIDPEGVDESSPGTPFEPPIHAFEGGFEFVFVS